MSVVSVRRWVKRSGAAELKSSGTPPVPDRRGGRVVRVDALATLLGRWLGLRAMKLRGPGVENDAAAADASFRVAGCVPPELPASRFTSASQAG